MPEKKVNDVRTYSLNHHNSYCIYINEKQKWTLNWKEPKIRESNV